MKIYYAHCLALYRTPQEARDIIVLQALGFEVVNPNHPTIQLQCDALRHDYAESPSGQFVNSSDAVMMTIFKPLVSSCHALAFRALPDGRIPSGVYKEISWAREWCKPIIELPHNIRGRGMSLGQTREYLEEVGQR